MVESIYGDAGDQEIEMDVSSPGTATHSTEFYINDDMVGFDVHIGDTVTVTAPTIAFGTGGAPATIMFDHWEKNGVNFTTSPTISFVASADATLRAVYVELTYTVSGAFSGFGINASGYGQNWTCDGVPAFYSGATSFGNICRSTTTHTWVINAGIHGVETAPVYDSGVGGDLPPVMNYTQVGGPPSGPATVSRP